MLLLSKKNALKVLYYLMMIDGAVSEDETSCFLSVGNDLDSDSFSTYKEELVTECKAQETFLFEEEDYADVIQEGVDVCLINNDLPSDEEGVNPRLLIWNMLTVAYSNGEYSAAERRLIKHIVRVTHVDPSVFWEMEQLIQASFSVSDELTWLKSSNRPYAEIRPVVEETEKRIKNIRQAANELIGDELYNPVEKTVIPNSKLAQGVKDLSEKINDKMPPVLHEATDKASQVLNSAREKVASATSSTTAFVGENTKKLFQGLKTRLKKKEQETVPEKEEQ